jgi:hypothetical protein
MLLDLNFLSGGVGGASVSPPSLVLIPTKSVIRFEEVVKTDSFLLLLVVVLTEPTESKEVIECLALLFGRRVLTCSARHGRVYWCNLTGGVGIHEGGEKDCVETAWVM